MRLPLLSLALLASVPAAWSAPRVESSLTAGWRFHYGETAGAEAAALGLAGMEVQHSDHNASAAARYGALAATLNLLPTGGSDYHGTFKPNVRLGSGINGNVRVPLAWLEALRR